MNETNNIQECAYQVYLSSCSIQVNMQLFSNMNTQQKTSKNSTQYSKENFREFYTET